MSRQAHTAVDLAEQPHLHHQAAYAYDWEPEPDTTEQWKRDAACDGLWHLFFPQHIGDRFDEARAICAACPVYDDCRSWVLDPTTRPVHGFVAGLTDRQRRRLRGEQRRRSTTVTKVTAHA